MSYRIGQKPKPKPRRSVSKINTPNTWYITNGSTFRLAYPSFYVPIDSAKIIKSKKVLEDIANNSSNRVPGIKRIHDSSRDIPIHFRKEYSNPQIEVVFDSKLEGISVLSAGIDQYPRDYIIRVVFAANCKSAQEKEQRCHFTIRLLHDNMKDVVCVGTLVVLPAIL